MLAADKRARGERRADDQLRRAARQHVARRRIAPRLLPPERLLAYL